MRRSAIAVALVLTWVMAGSAGASQGRALVTQFTGFNANALWSTLPQDGTSDPDTIYEGTDIFVSDGSAAGSGPRARFQDVFVSRVTFTVDEEGGHLIAQTFGFATGDQVSVEVDRKLRTARAAGSVETTTCVFETFECFPGPILSVEAYWTATGPVEAEPKSRFRDISQGCLVIDSSSFAAREASATGSVDGSAIAGELLAADISTFASGFIAVLPTAKDCFF